MNGHMDRSLQALTVASRSVASPPSPYVVPFSFWGIRRTRPVQTLAGWSASLLAVLSLLFPLFPLFLLSLAVLGTGCQRTPEEPRAKPSNAVVEVPLASAGNRLSEAPPADTGVPMVKKSAGCIAATPDAPPGPVPRPAATCPKDPEGPSMLPVQSLTLNEAKTTVRAEIARAPHDLEKGLMYRTQMAEDAGMLFRLGDRSVHRFWMHNTCIPLDLLFVDDDGTIVGIVENAPTLNDEERSVPCRSSFVLELNAGYSRRHNVRAGQHVTLPGA
jgi:hypothetical protein